MSGSWSLRDFLRGVSGTMHISSGEVSGMGPDVMERNDSGTKVEIVKPPKSLRKDKAVELAGFVDGIQSSRIIGYRDHLPTVLVYAAGACVKTGERRQFATGLTEKLALVSSHAHMEWLAEEIERAGGVESIGSPDLLPVPSSTPGGTESEIRDVISKLRDSTERRAADAALAETRDGCVIVVDGSLHGRPATEKLLGVVKTARTRYMDDESELWGLPEGWRSSVFKLDKGWKGFPSERFSCYVRLHDASKSSWHFGLIRLESVNCDLLDSAAAMCMEQRQKRASGDPRWDRHLAGVKHAEEYLRTRRPAFL